MLLRYLMDLYDVLDSPQASGEAVASYLRGIDPECDVETYALASPKGTTDMVRVRIPGAQGKAAGGQAPVSYTHLTLPTTSRV